MFISNAIEWKKDMTQSFLRLQNARTALEPSPPMWEGAYVFFCTRDLHRQRVDVESPFSRTPVRLPGEYLHQGGVFDKYGNKSVSNVQWNLEVDSEQDALLNPDGYSVSEVVLSTGWKFRWLGLQPVTMNGQTRLVAFGPATRYQYAEGSSNGETVRQEFRIWHVKVGDETKPIIVGRVVAACADTFRQSGRLCYGIRRREYVAAYTSSNANAWSTIYSSPYTYAEDRTAYDRYKVDRDYRLALVDAMILPSVPEMEFSSISAPLYEMTNDIGNLEGATLPDIDYEDLYKTFNQYRRFFEHSFSDADRSSVCSQIVDSINHFDGNMIAYAKDMPALGSSIRSVLDLVKDFKNPKQWASTWLSLRFADRLQIADTAELIAAMNEEIKAARKELAVFRAGSTYADSGVLPICRYKTSSTLTGTIVLSGGMLGDAENAFAAPFRWDLLPTLENVWDMVPFSFVVDWFYHVSDIFKILDQCEEVQLLDVKTQYSSTRTESTIPLADLGVQLHGTLTRIEYHRQPDKVSLWLRLNAFDSYWATSVQPLNLLDGTALLVQAF